MKEVYKINVYGTVDTYYIHSETPKGLVYLSQWKNANSCLSPMHYTVVYGDHPTYFKTRELALAKYIEEKAVEISYAATNLNKSPSEMMADYKGKIPRLLTFE